MDASFTRSAIQTVDLQINVNYRDYFYPLTESYEITTLLEASLGIQCWFTQAFREIYPATIERGHWVYVESTDNLWVDLGDRRIGDGWG